MYDAFKDLSPVLQAFIACTFTWGATALGAAAVFFFRDVKPRLLNASLGFASGVMIAASYWSLLAPAIELSGGRFLPATVGFLMGGFSLWALDKVLPHLHPGMATPSAEGIKTSWRRSVLLVLAITLHNVPEGLAVGVAFGAAASGLPQATLGAAVALAIGLGLQNFPEGLIVSFPLRREGLSRWRCFWYGQLSAVVEPVAAVVGVIAVLAMQAVLPYAMAFAAGAMIYVVIEELIPESQQGQTGDISTVSALIGFAVMMVLDVALG